MEPLVVALLVLFHSLSAGTPSAGCADTLRELTRHSAKITHAAPLVGTRLETATSAPAITPIPIERAVGAVAYVVEGPGNEVALLVCGLVSEEAPEPF